MHSIEIAVDGGGGDTAAQWAAGWQGVHGRQGREMGERKSIF
jgi:hypothetical protein